MSHDHVDIDQHVRQYMKVFGALIVLTIITVAVSYVDLTTGPAIAVALLIATFKGTLVATVFMHLNAEKKFIYILLAISLLFFSFELLIPMITESNNLNMGK
jgi:caa(3)-type oxidase subunit IV